LPCTPPPSDWPLPNGRFKPANVVGEGSQAAAGGCILLFV
jgi:hypothetical protein